MNLAHVSFNKKLLGSKESFIDFDYLNTVDEKYEENSHSQRSIKTNHMYCGVFSGLSMNETNPF